MILKGDSTLLVLHRLKQQKTVENLQRAQRAGLSPHCPSASKQQKQGTPSSTRSTGNRRHRTVAHKSGSGRGPTAGPVLVSPGERRTHVAQKVREEPSRTSDPRSGRLRYQRWFTIQEGTIVKRAVSFRTSDPFWRIKIRDVERKQKNAHMEKLDFACPA